MSKWSEFKLTEDQKSYAEWLLLPKWGRPEGVPANKGEYAAKIGVHRTTLTRWEKDREFREYLSSMSTEKSLDPVKVHEVIEAVHQAAINGDTKAMALYLQHADKLAPKRISIEDKRIEELSDEEFEAELAEVLGVDGNED